MMAKNLGSDLIVGFDVHESRSGEKTQAHGHFLRQSGNVSEQHVSKGSDYD